MRESCMYCGGTGIEDKASFRPPVCAACKSTMKPHPDPKIPVLHCNSCKSLWFGRELLETHLATLEVQVAETDDFDRPIAPTRQQPQAVEYRKCPSCDAPMKRENYRRISGIIVDTCQRHGTFLDAGELELLVAFIEAGGAAAADHHQQREDKYIEETERRSEEMTKTLREVSRARTSRYQWGGFPHRHSHDPTNPFTLWDMLTGSDKFFGPK